MPGVTGSVCNNLAIDMDHIPDNPTDNNSDKKDNTTPSIKGPEVIKTKPLVRRVIFFGFLAALFWGLAQVLPVFDHIFILPSILLLLLAIIFSALGLRRHLLNSGATKRNANLCSVPVVILGAILCVFLCWKMFAQAEPKPHVKLLLKFPNFPNTNIELTNKLLFIDFRRTNIFKPFGYLVVPVNSNHGSVKLILSAMNDSPSPIDGIMAVVTFSANLECSFDHGWVPAVASIVNSKSLCFRDNHPLYSDTDQHLPGLAFTRSSGWSNTAEEAMIIVSTMAKNINRSSVGFRIMGLNPINHPEPLLLFTKGDTNLLAVPGVSINR